MNEVSLPTRLDPRAEDYLRSTLQSQRPALHIEQEWAIVSQRLAIHTRKTGGAAPYSFHLYPPLSLWRKKAIAFPALALLALLLMAAGYTVATVVNAGGYSYVSNVIFYGIKDGHSQQFDNTALLAALKARHPFHSVQQQQNVYAVTTSSGAHITLLSAYADRGITYIEYSLSLPPALIDLPAELQGIRVKDQFGEMLTKGEALQLCDKTLDAALKRAILDCIMQLPAFHPANPTAQLMLTMDIAHLTLSGSDTRSSGTLQPPELHFQFQTLYHGNNLTPYCIHDPHCLL